MLYDFLATQRARILDACENYCLTTFGSARTAQLFANDWPVFYDQVAQMMTNQPEAREEAIDPAALTQTRQAAKNVGKEFFETGCTVEEIVHGYGSMCQGITGTACTEKFSITSAEYRQLNLILDIAIAEAVAEFDRLQAQAVGEAEVERLGYLAHELRNALAGAVAAYRLIQSGAITSESETGDVLPKSLDRIKHLVDNSLSEVRTRMAPIIEMKEIGIAGLIVDVLAAIATLASDRNIQVKLEVMPEDHVYADSEFLLSALINLVQNAIKFTPDGGSVTLRSKQEGPRIMIDVEDECGGLDDTVARQIFQPFRQHDTDRSGLGLGLVISRRAIELNHGHLVVSNLPGKGCIFTIELPTAKPHANA